MNLYIFKYNKIVNIFLIILFYILFTINQKEVLCENNDLIKKTIQCFSEELHKYVRQEDFKEIYNSRFYENIILSESFIDQFLRQLNLENLITRNIDKDTTFLKKEVLNQFHIYIEQKQIIYQQQVIKNSFMQSIGNLNKLLEQHIIFKSYTDNAEICITTPGFEKHIKEMEYQIIQQFIKSGIVFKIDVDADQIVLTVSWYDIYFIKKNIKL